MHNYTLNHLRTKTDAVGARIKMNTSSEEQGTIIELVKDTFPYSYKVEMDDGTTITIVDQFPLNFFIHVELKDGIKVMDMTGEVYTLGKHKHGDAFYTQKNDDPESYKEYIEPNGFAYHYDCGCNILKVIA